MFSFLRRLLRTSPPAGKDKQRSVGEGQLSDDVQRSAEVSSQQRSAVSGQQRSPVSGHHTTFDGQLRSRDSDRRPESGQRSREPLSVMVNRGHCSTEVIGQQKLVSGSVLNGRSVVSAEQLVSGSVLNSWSVGQC